MTYQASGTKIIALVSKRFAGWSSDDDAPRFFPVLYEFGLSGALDRTFGSQGFFIPRPTAFGTIKDVLAKPGGFWALGNSYPAEPLTRRQLLVSEYDFVK